MTVAVVVGGNLVARLVAEGGEEAASISSAMRAAKANPLPRANKGLCLQ